MILADLLPAHPDRSWDLARQLDLTHAEDLPHGYAQLGRLFAIGYMKGILDTARISYV